MCSGRAVYSEVRGLLEEWELCVYVYVCVCLCVCVCMCMCMYVCVCHLCCGGEGVKADGGGQGGRLITRSHLLQLQWEEWQKWEKEEKWEKWQK